MMENIETIDPFFLLRQADWNLALQVSFLHLGMDAGIAKAKGITNAAMEAALRYTSDQTVPGPPAGVSRKRWRFLMAKHVAFFQHRYEDCQKGVLPP